MDETNARKIIDQGYVITNLYGFLGINEIPWIISQFFTGLTFIIIVNAYNFIDGIDGLAISETLKNLCFFLFLLPPNDSFYNLAYVLIFISFPFYFFNLKKRKKVFLGDAGSLFLGGVNIVFLFHFLNPNTTVNIVIGIKKILFGTILLSYPLIDLTRVVIIRIINRRSPFTADQNHIHHWFISKGFSHIKTTFIVLLGGTILLFFTFWI